MRTCVALVLISLVALSGLCSQSPRRLLAELATPTECHVTEPNDIHPPESANVFGRDAGAYGNAYLWTALWSWGVGAIEVPNDHLASDGTAIDLKWPWYRFVEGELTIEGRRLDADAPTLESHVINSSYGAIGFIPSSLTFPTDGCWEITGRVGSGKLTFVVLVVWPDGFAPDASPVASPVASPPEDE